MNKIYRFDYDCGRMGSVEGLFVADSKEVDSLIKHGRLIRFGEILGKHSYVICQCDIRHFTVVTDDQDFVTKFIEIMGTGTISGYNPLDYLNNYLNNECDNCGDKMDFEDYDLEADTNLCDNCKEENE